MVSIGLNALSKLQVPRSDEASSLDSLLKKLDVASATVAQARKEVKQAQVSFPMTKQSHITYAFL